jgi:sugar lactone lactonase YvrE
MTRSLGVKAVVAAFVLAASTAVVSMPAVAAHGGTTGPEVIQLPDGFQPEGITIGRAPYAYLGSLADGRIYRANLNTGTGAVISPPVGSSSVGLKIDHRGRLFVAGGATGEARVIDSRTGALLASYDFADGTTFVNDVVLTRNSAFFTDSTRAVLYRLALGPGGSLPGGFETIELSGDFVLDPDPAAFNLNGIAPTPDRRALITVQSSTGLLFRVDPVTGVTRRINTGGATFVNGDGLLLLGSTLYVVRNFNNLVAAVTVNPSGTRGVVRAEVTDPRFDVPTTVAAFRGRLYLPNARFTTPPTPTTPYTVVSIPRP